MAKSEQAKHKHLSCQCKLISYDGSADDELVLRVCDWATGEEHLEYVAWIPKQKAIVGKWLKIDGVQGNWKVAEVWGTRTIAETKERSRDHLHQRKASDV